MATLNTSNGQFAQTFTVNQQAGSYILLSTANKYVDKDIKIITNVKLATSAKDTASASTSLYTTDGSNAGVNIGATSGVVGTKATTEPASGYYIAVTASGSGNSKITGAGWIAAGSLAAATATSTEYYPIQTATGSVTMTKGNGSCTLQTSANVTTSDTDTSGVSVTFRGSGAVSATAKITTAGYTPVNNSFATGSSTSSNTADLTKYITGVTLTKGKTFSITVPNGPLNSNGTNNDVITFVFTVANDNTGNVTVAGPD